MIYGGSQESQLRLACALTGVIACASAGRARALSLIFALDAERDVAGLSFSNSADHERVEYCFRVRLLGVTQDRLRLRPTRPSLDNLPLLLYQAIGTSPHLQLLQLRVTIKIQNQKKFR